MIFEECQHHREESPLQVALVTRLSKLFQRTIGLNVVRYREGDENTSIGEYKRPNLDVVVLSFRIRIWV